MLSNKVFTILSMKTYLAKINYSICSIQSDLFYLDNSHYKSAGNSKLNSTLCAVGNSNLTLIIVIFSLKARPIFT